MQSPTAFFGFTPGSDRHIVHWDKLCAYYRLLAAESDRVRCIEMGKTTLGNPFLALIISSPENLTKLDDYRDISMRISDPRGLDDQTIARLCEDGRAVCMQSMSLHADEIGGAQMAPALAFDLATGQTPEIAKILQNVIFIMVPSFNPDGLDMIANWYDETLDTPYEGSGYPKIWHPYGGHSNNRDAIAENLVESRYVNQLLFREWMPQAYQDHHHQGAFSGRFFIVPYENPVRPFCSPLIWRELAFYGSNMAIRLESEGIRGVISDAIYPCRGHFGFHYMVNSHNIAGMLTESASARLATPIFIHEEQLNNPIENTHCPNPWPGGEWHLSDIVRQQYIAAMGLLSTMANHRSMVLRNMVQKALRQTHAGETNSIQAFLIPPDQHDRFTAYKLVDILQRQGIELSVAAEPVAAKSGVYPAGTVIVPLAQPKYGVIMTLLARSDYPDNEFTRRPDGSIAAYDVMTDNIAEYMGVCVVPAFSAVKVKTKPYCVSPGTSDLNRAFPASENDSFRQANALLNAGHPVFRASNGDFHANTCPEGALPVRLARLGVFQARVGGNPDEGYTRLLLEQFGFPYKTVEPDNLIEALNDLDVLLVPSYSADSLRGRGTDPETLPPAYRSWLTEDHEQALRDFVERGGRLLAFDAAVMYAVDVLRLRIRNRAEGQPASAYNTHGSTLRVNVSCSPYTLGMPQDALVLHFNSAALEITERVNPEKYRCDVRFIREKLLMSGLLIGEKYIKGLPCMITAQVGEGEAVLYAFSPQYRAQTDGTFKLLFNTLYIM
ncbi:MAG: peptidase M14 family protein [Ruminococcaceae bacterium]|nr:peptidase M14 family protein [Oscillospiraceae bacterium]